MKEIRKILNVKFHFNFQIHSYKVIVINMHCLSRGKSQNPDSANNVIYLKRLSLKVLKGTELKDLLLKRTGLNELQNVQEIQKTKGLPI